MERRPRAHSKGETRANSSDSSPPIVGGPSLEHNEHLNPYHAIPLNTQIYPSSTATWNNGIVSPMTRGETVVTSLPTTITYKPHPPVDPRSLFDFNQPPQPQSHWQSPFPEAGSLSAGHSSPGDLSHPHWGRHTDSPLTPGFSPHMSAPGTVHSMDSRNSFTSFAPARNDAAWSGPTRSMSIGVVEDLPPSYHKNVFHPQPLPVDFRRRASEMHPPSLITSADSSHTSISESGMTPLSAPVSSPPSHWGIPSTWNSLPSSAATKTSDFNNWYSEPALAKVQEEEIPPPYGEQPTILYAGGEQQ